MKDESGAWVPVCAHCKTDSIVALFGQHRCLDCGIVWDGSERGSADIFGLETTAQIEPDCQDVVMDILALMWRAGRIENQHGNQARSGEV